MDKASALRAALRFDVATMRKLPAFRSAIAAEKNRYIVAQVAAWKRTGGLSDTLDHDHAAKMDAIFRKFYGEVIAIAVKETPRTISGLKSSPALEKKLADHETALRLWYQKHGGERALATSRTTRADIRRLMLAAFDEGEPEAVVLRQGLLARSLSAWRADTIARTEIHTAAAFASDQTARSMASEVGAQLEKAWVFVSDERTREDHAAMDSSDYIPLDEDFDVGGEAMEYPGDPTASAENVINCRCSVVRRVAV